MVSEEIFKRIQGKGEGTRTGCTLVVTVFTLRLMIWVIVVAVLLVNNSYSRIMSFILFINKISISTNLLFLVNLPRTTSGP